MSLRGFAEGRRNAPGLAMKFASAVLIISLTSSCGEGEQESGVAARADDSVLTVYVVNYPLQYLAERIGGDLIRVEFPAPPDVDPAYWTPEAAVVVAYQDADVILLNGADYAAWVGMASLPASKMVNTSAGFEDGYIRIEDAMTHSHGLEGEHSHGETAFTTWLDPTLALMQAEAILAALVESAPEAEESFRAGLESLERDLMAIDEGVANALARRKAGLLLGSHPVYQYFARRYGLNMKSVHFEPDEFPDEGAWRELQGLLSEHPAQWMIWEAEPLPEITARLEELGVRSVVFEPCANAPDTGDYLSVMRRNVRNLETALGGM